MFAEHIWFWGFLILHILLCALILCGILFKVLKVRKLMFLVALFMPVWGPLIVFILHFQIWMKQTAHMEIGVEKFKIESELYKGITREESRVSGSTVSIEEALIVNTPKERRALIMDILNDNPKAYVDFLKLAGNNEDTEVVHYAVTAMVQISKENDQMLWEFERKYADDPDNLEILTPYCDFLWRCLEQGLMQGQVEKMNRNLFDTLIQKKIHLSQPDLIDYIRCIQNSLLMKNYTEAGAMLERAGEIWSRNEELLILRIQYAADLGRGDDIKALLDELEEQEVYLSAKAKEVIPFWRE